jgi:predicted 3-demethylubiquinone-9 3-methyltransferase (glyoxalase superfamily)
MSDKQKIKTFLWFNDNAEEAVNFYVSIFKDSKILNVTRSGEAGPGPKGSVLTINFQLQGQEFIALNGGPQFKFTEAISLFVECDSQEEVDALWRKLTAGGSEIECGWLKDKFGLFWQIVPSVFFKLVGDKDPQKSARVMAAMLKMKKMDIAALQRAYDNR